jgi:hypothetical protein
VDASTTSLEYLFETPFESRYSAVVCATRDEKPSVSTRFEMVSHFGLSRV